MRAFVVLGCALVLCSCASSRKPPDAAVVQTDFESVRAPVVRARPKPAPPTIAQQARGDRLPVRADPRETASVSRVEPPAVEEEPVRTEEQSPEEPLLRPAIYD